MTHAPAVLKEAEARAEEPFDVRMRRASDLLAAGDAGAAREEVSRAQELRPGDLTALALLGQAFYKLGRFDEASEAYAKVVDESPVEATPRVNLGLANLKAGRHAQAVRQLEIALDLAPDHRKAMGYLGLALLEGGDPARARPWFERAGKGGMVARCDELLARPAAALAAARGEGEWTAVEGAPVSEPESLEVVLEPDDALPAEEAGLATFALARRVRPPVQRFSVEGGRLLVRVEGDVLAREDGLLGTTGAVRLQPEMKRFRARSTGKPFGDEGRRMLRAAGSGLLVYSAGAFRLGVVELGGEGGYFVEEAVFAFDDALAYENGRVASASGPGLDLLHLRGHGQALLATAGTVLALAVAPGAPARVALGSLVGFTGALTPRLAPLAVPLAADAARSALEPLVVELDGDGFALVDAGPAR